MCAVLFEVALGSSQGQLQTRLRFCSEFYFKTFIAQKYVAYIASKRTFLIKSVYNYYTKRYQRPLSPMKGDTRQSWSMDSTPWNSDSSHWIPDSTSKNFPDSGIWVASKRVTFWLILWTFSLQKWWTCQFSLLILTVLVYDTKLLNRNLVFLIPTTLSVRKVRIEITRRNSK